MQTTSHMDQTKSTLVQPVCETNPIVYLDIDIGKERAGRIIIELRKDVVPKSCENFRGLCTGEYGIGKLGKPLHYKGVRFHKVTRVFVAQSGDVVNNNGSSGESIYGPVFEDENFLLPHEEGVVSMANYGKPNTNNSQFAITSVPCSNLNGTNVVVGRVLRGLGVVNDMELVVTDEGRPTKDIVIRDCGEIQLGEDWGFADKDETADVLPPYPNDWHRRDDDFNTLEMTEILTNIRKAGNHFFTKQNFYDARRKYRKANRYYQYFRRRYEWQDLPEYNLNSAEVKELDRFASINNLNIAAVELKLEEFVSARYASTEALRLDQNCSKAYFRRGQAQIALQRYEEAIDDLKHAQDLLPENKQILTELNRAKALLAEHNRKQMHALKNLFS